MKRVFALFLVVAMMAQLALPAWAEEPEAAVEPSVFTEEPAQSYEDVSAGDQGMPEPAAETPTAAPAEAEAEAPTVAPTEAPTVAPTEAATEAPAGTEAATESPTEAATEAPTEAPTEEPTEESTEAAQEPVRVVFSCTPEDLTLLVYPADADIESAIDAENDGTYLLLPGDYAYLAAAEGYDTAEGTFTVPEGAEPVSMIVTLTATQDATETPDTLEADGELGENCIQSGVPLSVTLQPNEGRTYLFTAPESTAYKFWVEGSLLSENTIMDGFFIDADTREYICTLSAPLYATAGKTYEIRLTNGSSTRECVLRLEKCVPIKEFSIVGETSGNVGDVLTLDYVTDPINVADTFTTSWEFFDNGDIISIKNDGTFWGVSFTLVREGECTLYVKSSSGLTSSVKITAAQRSAELASGKCGDNLTWILGEDHTLTISGTGPMYDYDELSDSPPWSTSVVQKVVLEPGITHIGADAFVTSAISGTVTIPEGVVSIGARAFGYTRITDVQFPNSLKSIDSFAFYASSIRDVYVPANVSEIGPAALSCFSLNKITVDDENSSFTAFGGALYSKDMTRLLTVESASAQSIVLPDSVLSIDERAFENSFALKEVTIGANVSGFSELRGMNAFRGCYQLTKITVSPDNQWMCDRDGILFSKDGRKLLAYPANKTGRVCTVPSGTTELDYMCFGFSQNLVKLILPDGVETLGDYIAFGCSNLKTVVVPQSVTDMGCSFDSFAGSALTIRGYAGSAAEAYAKARGFQFVELQEGIADNACGDDLTWTLTEDGVLTISGTGPMYDYDYSSDPSPWSESNIQRIVLEPGITHIGAGAFTASSISGTVTIPEGVESIGYSAFANCGINNVQFPSSLKKIGGFAFYQSNNIQSISIPANVSEIGTDAFNGIGLSKITVEDGSAYFALCDGGLYSKDMTRLLAVEGLSAQSIVIPDSVLSIDPYTFQGATALNTIKLGKGVSDFGTFETPFIGCSQLVSITVADDSESLSSRDGILSSKDGQKLIAYPANKPGEIYFVPAGTTELVPMCFFGNQNLTELVLPDGVETLGYSIAFGCDNLETVVIPKTITNIGHAFDNRIGSSLTIKGYAGSAAETYAKAHGFQFEEIETSIQPGVPLSVTLQAGESSYYFFTAPETGAYKFWNEGGLFSEGTAVGGCFFDADTDEFISITLAPLYAVAGKTYKIEVVNGNTDRKCILRLEKCVPIKGLSIVGKQAEMWAIN